VNRTSLINSATLLVPLVCLILSGAVVFYEWRRNQQLADDRLQVEKQIAFHEKLMGQITQMPQPSRMPTVEMTENEQPSFLNSLRLSADAYQVRLVRWSNAVPVPGAGGSADDPARKIMPAGVIPIASQVELQGRYEQVRQFLYELMRSPRLLNISDIRWSRGEPWPNTRLTFTLTRYVTQGPSPFSEPTGGTAPPGRIYGAPGAFETRGEGRSAPPPVPPPGQPLGPSSPERMPGQK
jgi:hypothetical protein